MDENLRQQTDQLRTVAALANVGKAGQALKVLGDKVVEHQDPAARAAELWLDLSPEKRAETAIFASGRETRADINDGLVRGRRRRRPTHPREASTIKGRAVAFHVRKLAVSGREQQNACFDSLERRPVMDKPLPLLIALVSAVLLLKALGVRNIFGPPRPVAKRFLTPRETAMLNVLERALPHCRIHAQVAMGALLRVPQSPVRKSKISDRNAFSQKIVDFVAQDRATGLIVALIEVDDWSHNPFKDRVRDEMTAYAGYRTIRVPGRVQPNFNDVMPIVASLRPLSVPDWMRPGVGSFTTPAFVPGCAPLAYRPSGFLSREAENRRALYYGMMSSIACEHGIPTGLFDAMIIRESRYNPTALSPKNAFGFAQLMPGTAMGLGVNRFDPYQNMRGGARYLRQQLDKFGRVQLALAAYNAGPGRVRGGFVPRITETQAYVTDIIANWSRLTAPPGSQTLRSTLPQPTYRSVALAQF